MKYALTSRGKRLRPLLVLAVARCFTSTKQSPKDALPAAMAVEYIHTYSLIHDDLPAMDNDDYRRGRPSVHRRFDEGLAILAGDALLADAYYFASLSKNNALMIVQELAKATGSLGLPAGQAEDLIFSHANFEAKLLINNAKTARLFEACAVSGAYSVNAEKSDIEKARQFGEAFGIAFQLQDDKDDGECDDIILLNTMLEEAKARIRNIVDGFSNNHVLVNLITMSLG